MTFVVFYTYNITYFFIILNSIELIVETNLTNICDDIFFNKHDKMMIIWHNYVCGIKWFLFSSLVLWNIINNENSCNEFHDSKIKPWQKLCDIPTIRYFNSCLDGLWDHTLPTQHLPNLYITLLRQIIIILRIMNYIWPSKNHIHINLVRSLIRVHVGGAGKRAWNCLLTSVNIISATKGLWMIHSGSSVQVRVRMLVKRISEIICALRSRVA